MLLISKNLGKQYFIEKGIFSRKPIIINALQNINFQLKESAILGVLGETGSGKTTLAKLIVKLIEPSSGEIIYNISNIRREIQMIFQNPFGSLNPMKKIKNILKEPFLIHGLANKTNIEYKIKTLLRKVNLDDDCLERFPDEFSGGQRQRIAIARAISTEPKILVCDEPTSSLDLSVQAQILNLFIRLKYELRLSYIFISHNIEVISFIADEILILYKGIQIERGAKEKIFTNPIHPYTKMLLGIDIVEFEKMIVRDNLEGCKFFNNCKFSSDICKNSFPEEVEIEKEHYVSCHNIR